MLDLDRVDLGELSSALEDNSPDHAWWLDPESGALELRSEYFDGFEEDEEPSERSLVFIDPIGSHEAYADMEDFATRIRDPRARDLLVRAIAGRGAFRRFKDTLLDFPDLREAWFQFHDARMRRRAIAWLRDRELIASAAIGRHRPSSPDHRGSVTPTFPRRSAAARALPVKALEERRRERERLLAVASRCVESLARPAPVRAATPRMS